MGHKDHDTYLQVFSKMKPMLSRLCPNQRPSCVGLPQLGEELLVAISNTSQQITSFIFWYVVACNIQVSNAIRVQCSVGVLSTKRFTYTKSKTWKETEVMEWTQTYIYLPVPNAGVSKFFGNGNISNGQRIIYIPSNAEMDNALYVK